MKAKSTYRDCTIAMMHTIKGTCERTSFGGVFRVWCYDRVGNLRWHDTAQNMVVAAGINSILDVVFAGSTQITTWYVGLTDGTPTVASGDTISSHAGWGEQSTEYDEAARPTFVDVRTTHTVSNSASKASYTINTAVTVGGAFLASAPNKGGATGTLMCAAAFTGGDKTLGDGDTLNVQYDFTGADS